MVPFAGWNMPVQYTGILDEHKAVRETCGIFDISHMGQFTVAGDSAAAWLNSMLTNDINKLNVGQGQYSVMLNDRAGVIDDLILYRMEPETFFVVVNASKIDEDFAWLSAHQPAGVTLENHSDEYVGLAVQGPECGGRGAADPRDSGRFNAGGRFGDHRRAQTLRAGPFHHQHAAAGGQRESALFRDQHHALCAAAL